MKEEWIEQPAFETNDFKVGDRVRVYDETFVYNDIVHDIKKDILLVRWADGRVSDFHFKQCRLLKPRERRVWWVEISPKEGFMTCAFENIKNSMEPKTGKWIKVQEVFEDE